VIIENLDTKVIGVLLYVQDLNPCPKLRRTVLLNDFYITYWVKFFPLKKYNRKVITILLFTTMILLIKYWGKLWPYTVERLSLSYRTHYRNCNELWQCVQDAWRHKILAPMATLPFPRTFWALHEIRLKDLYRINFSRSQQLSKLQKMLKIQVKGLALKTSSGSDDVASEQ